MAKLIDPDDVIVGTNLTVNTTLKTIALNVGGSLIAKDGVTLQALYSKCINLWTTDPYNRYPFPFYTIDARSGQFQVGTDGSTYNGWTFADDSTRQMVRDAGWSEYSNAGVLNRQYVGVVALASGFSSGAQFYYQRASGGSAVNFTFTDAPNEGIQVFGDSTNGNFDNRTYFKMFCREYNYTYDDAVLGDIGETATGAFKISLPISVSSDLKIQDNDSEMTNAPYTNIDITYYGTSQNRTIGGTQYPFRIIIDGNSASLEEVYTKIQYLLRQNTDIDEGAGTVTGKTANSLCYFVGDTLYTTQGVYIDNLLNVDSNRIVFTDYNNVQRTNPFTSAGTITANSFLVGAGSYYRMYFTSLPGASNDYGESGAITVKDASTSDITGTISSNSIPFNFDYDNNVQGGRTSGTEATVTIVAGRPGYAKPVVATGIVSRSKTISIALVAEADRAYIS
jgi:hypothetical protein